MIRFLRSFVIAVFVAGTVPAPAASPVATGGFLFTTFRGESTPDTEQIYFGLSQDGLRWEALNDGKPILSSDVGERGVRNSHLLRAHDGKNSTFSPLISLERFTFARG